MAEVTSVKEIFENMEEGFNAEKAEGVDAVFQFVLTGDNGANYWIRVKDQKVDVHEGTAENPSITITASADDYMAVVNGKLNAMVGFMQGKIKVKGDMGLALKLQSIFGIV